MSKTFCVLPFVHLATHPNGDVTPCCDSALNPTDKNGNKLNLNTNTVDEIRNSDSYQKLRSDMINGIQNPACSFCWDAESKNLESRRERENEKYSVNDVTKNYYIDNFYLLNVELRLGNVCNMKCLICHPHSSSKWNEDSDALTKSNFRNFYEDVDLYSKKIIEKEWYRTDFFYQQLINDYPKLNHLWINGGEPTLIKEHYQFLKKLIDNGKSKKISLEYNINGSNISDELISLWKQFRFVQVTISMDDIGDRIFYQRYPTKFDDVINTIKKLEKNDVVYTIIPTISLYNVYNVVNILEYINKNTRGNRPGLNFVYHPYHLTISNLPNIEKETLISMWKKSNIDSDYLDTLIFEISKKENYNINTFKKYTEILDKKRNLKVLDYLPEYEWLFADNKLL